MEKGIIENPCRQKTKAGWGLINWSSDKPTSPFSFLKVDQGSVVIDTTFNIAQLIDFIDIQASTYLTPFYTSSEMLINLPSDMLAFER